MCCVLLTLKVSAQQPDPSNLKASRDFVFEIPRMDMVKTLPVFKGYIRANPEIEFAGFCESRNLMMLKMPENDLGIVTQALQSMNLTYFLKQNATVAQAISTCEYKEEIEISKASN
jgi:hypothetical protein